MCSRTAECCGAIILELQYGHVEFFFAKKNTQNIHLILLQKSIGMHHLVIVHNKCHLMLSAGFLAVFVTSWGAEQPEFAYGNHITRGKKRRKYIYIGLT